MTGGGAAAAVAVASEKGEGEIERLMKEEEEVSFAPPEAAISFATTASKIVE